MGDVANTGIEIPKLVEIQSIDMFSGVVKDIVNEVERSIMMMQ